MFDEIEENILPQALMIGIDYDLFWSLNPKSLAPFVKAFSLKQKENDRNMWIQGLYIRMAVASSLSTKCKYPQEAFMSQKENKELDMLVIKDRFMKHANLLNSRFRKES